MCTAEVRGQAEQESCLLNQIQPLRLFRSPLLYHSKVTDHKRPTRCGGVLGVCVCMCVFLWAVEKGAQCWNVAAI